MSAAAFSDFNSFDFVLLDMKIHKNELDPRLKKDLNSIERKIKSILLSRKKMDTAVNSIIPHLFSFRISALAWLAEEKITLDSALDETCVAIEPFQQNSKIRKIGVHLSEMLTYNRKLILFFTEETGTISERSLEEVASAKPDYATFMFALRLLPANVRQLVIQLTDNSLRIEFLSIAAYLLHLEEIRLSDARIKQMTEFAAGTRVQYIGLVNHLISLARSEKLAEENKDWNLISHQSFAQAYSGDEPDYDNYIIKEPNPDFGL